MTIKSRIYLGISAILLSLLYVLPIWHISLKAPQYPEGLGLLICIDKINGEGDFDLQNLNGLNHYIGMQKIEPASIPELKIMPVVVGFFIIFGLLAALIGKRYLAIAFIILFFVGAVGGLADFWKWEYEYGHNLNPEAAIKIPGMTYQPPFIGTEQLLNITATSLPASGGIVAFISFALAGVAVWQSKKSVSAVRTQIST